MTDPTARPPADPTNGTGDEPTATPQRRWWYVAAAAAVVLALVAFVLVRGGDDDPDEGATSTTSSTSTSTTTNTSTTAATTSTEPQTTSTTGATSTTPTTLVEPPVVDRATVIWPDAASPSRTEPVDAARGFATEYLGFADPTVGPYRAGDARSGEVEVRPEAAGPVTTILVRQLADDAWYVLGATTTDVTLTEPAALAAITSPVVLRGRALAFEGQVAVEIREDGVATPIGEGAVTGGGDVVRPFEGSVGFAPPTRSAGAIVLLVRSARDGAVWQAVAVRVRLG